MHAMKVAVITVLYDGDWQAEAANLSSRIKLMGRCLTATADADLTLFPAGFFVVSEEAERQGVERECEHLLQGHTGVVAFGIDVRDDDGHFPLGQDSCRIYRKGGAPSW